MSQLQDSTSTPARNQQESPLNPTRDTFAVWDKPLSALGRTHFVGIGGAGMSVLAQMLSEAGLEVTGSDRQASAKTAELESLGIKIAIGQAAANVEGAQTVVWSSAIKPDNPEIVAAQAQGSLLAHRSDILALLLASRQGVTVAGAHGKTTTSALLAHILRSAGQGDLADPSYAIGGSIQTAEGTQDGGHLGSGQVLVAEADESDGSFEKYHPKLALITNVEADHLDHYGSSEAFRAAFAGHARHAREAVIVCGDDAGARLLLQDLRKDYAGKVVVYTTASEAQIEEAGWDIWAQVVRIESESESSGSGQEHFQLELPADLVNQLGVETEQGSLAVSLAIPGIHNARNATAAISAAICLGMRPSAAVEAAGSFLGAARRFDLKGHINGVSVVDDYAHHPTEIAALLAAARRRYPQAQLRVLFQPHMFSRTQIFARAFAQALATADDVVVTGVYPARELQANFPSVGAHTIVDAYHDLGEQSGSVERIEAIDDMREGALALAKRAQPGDVVLTVGAGDITRMGAVIVDELKAQGEQASEGSLA
ncbi:UDP-N-acetylmuramate--L-alanine ligase [Bombiscardovia apis]|uniref:UDP-N-acetylmuramate--L-alanine ligase n=1 Tax=Bombiscardovia apis TaxID=2932182 RepID=A0ABN6SGI9_9BIFI|nr:UDP-N-acetylmuramate--L-alanine ligase [Bombiscardovia apis]BDR54397.1 UDP-N-acetylmuramate--L-alanine ligase [Bombiscardovia apis]